MSALICRLWTFFFLLAMSTGTAHAFKVDKNEFFAYAPIAGKDNK